MSRDRKDYMRKYGKQYRQEHKQEIQEYNRRYNQEHKEELGLKAKQWYQEHKEEKKLYREQVRLEALSHYSVRGVLRCAKCGNADIEVLVIDHIEGGGAEHRKRIHSGSQFYHWLRKNNYPEGFQVLCRNCNWKKSLHEDKEE